MPLTRRPYRFFEINDQSFFPPFLRARVQAVLTKCWTTNPLSFLGIQADTPSLIAADVIEAVLENDPISDGAKVWGEDAPKAPSEWMVIDFGSGAGGPVPYIAATLNQRRQKNGKNLVEVYMTDLAPHVPAWVAAVRDFPSSGLKYIAQSVDAASPPQTMFSNGTSEEDSRQKKTLRMFCLAFHHFPDPLAKDILRSALEGSDAFVIFEIQDRSFQSLFLIGVCFPVLLLFVSLLWFWDDPVLLLFSYLCPIVPFVLVFDGIVSLLRTRTFREVLQLMDGNDQDWDALREGWSFQSGSKNFVPLLAKVSWVIGQRLNV
jgi:hypothetical protein